MGGRRTLSYDDVMRPMYNAREAYHGWEGREYRMDGGFLRLTWSVSLRYTQIALF
jgi:hypothetical protein